MKILIFGAGVLGSYYAAKLFNAKLDVTIFARGEKYKNIKEKGIMLENYLSDEKIIAPVKVIDKLDSTDFDLVLVFVQRIHVKNILPELAKIKNAKSFIFFGNNFIGFEKACNMLG
ncbi:MAG: alpha/beta hydrolase, partial [Candidatus Atribacteria bacterium]|nr:alpha/beta hydrolase [Candidatus Atribacteria bacterium]